MRCLGLVFALVLVANDCKLAHSGSRITPSFVIASRPLLVGSSRAYAPWMFAPKAADLTDRKMNPAAETWRINVLHHSFDRLGGLLL